MPNTSQPKTKPKSASEPVVPAKTVAKKAAPAAKTGAAKQPASSVKSLPKALELPSMHFHHSAKLRDQTLAVLEKLESGTHHASHGQALSDLVNELIDAGMDYFFLRPLQLAEVGFVTEQSARLGMSGAVRLISSVSRKFIERMDKKQLLVVAAHIRSLTTNPAITEA